LIFAENQLYAVTRHRQTTDSGNGTDQKKKEEKGTLGTCPAFVDTRKGI